MKRFKVKEIENMDESIVKCAIRAALRQAGLHAPHNKNIVLLEGTTYTQGNSTGILSIICDLCGKTNKVVMEYSKENAYTEVFLSYMHEEDMEEF